MRECSIKQTFLIYIVHYLDKSNISKTILQTVHTIQSHDTTSAQYPITCYNQCTVSNHMLQPVHNIQSHVTTSVQYRITYNNQCPVSNHMYLYSHLPTKNCEAPRCVCSLYTPAHHTNWQFPLHNSTPHQLTEVADIHTEHSQLPHVNVNSHTCRNTALHYTAVPTYSRRLILNRNTTLRLFICKIIGDILTKAHKSYFITQN